MKKLIFPAIILSSFGMTPFAFGRQMAVLGDSLSTGAVTRTGMAFDDQVLMRYFRGELLLGPTAVDRETLLSSEYDAAADFRGPRRLAPLPGEMKDGLSWVVRNALFRFGHAFLDQETFAWGNLLARRAGVASNDVLIAADDGARAEHAYGQAGRILEQSAGHLPDDVFLFFTGNDLCGPTADKITTADQYAASLEKAVRYLMRNGTPAPQGTTLWLVEPMPVMQLVHSPAIAAKTVSAHGKSTTCRELQSGSVAAPDLPITSAEDADWAFLMRFFPKSPGDMCPAIFRGTAGDLNLADRLHAYRRAMSAIPERLEVKDGYRVRVVSETASLLFEPQDIAEDCFHLSLRGQIKLADTVRKGMKDTGLQAKK